MNSLYNVDEEQIKDEIASPREEVQNSTFMDTVISPKTLNEIIGLIAQNYFQ